MCVVRSLEVRSLVSDVTDFADSNRIQAFLRSLIL